MGGFGLFNDTWFQYAHSVSCMTILFETVWCREGQWEHYEGGREVGGFGLFNDSWSQ